MRKMMFSDAFQLTQAVLFGRKTQTRRIISKSVIDKADEYRIEYYNGTLSGISEKEAIEQLYFVEKRLKLPYEVGEVVAIAQSYKDAGVIFLPEEDDEFGCYNFPAEQTHGWTNKMFTRADLMPNRIRIINVRVERLNDISEDDCFKEGIYASNSHEIGYGIPWVYGFDKCKELYFTPREAYAALIDRISGKGTWEGNPYVFVYEFEHHRIPQKPPKADSTAYRLQSHARW